MGIPIIRQTDQLPKLKKQLSSRKLIVSFREALLNAVISPSSSKFYYSSKLFFTSFETEVINSVITFLV